MEYTPLGHAANLASRLQTVHQLVSETRKVAEGYFEFHALGQIQVKGVRQPIDIFEVTGPRSLANAVSAFSSTTDSPSSSVREHELGQIVRTCYARAWADVRDCGRSRGREGIARRLELLVCR